MDDDVDDVLLLLESELELLEPEPDSPPDLVPPESLLPLFADSELLDEPFEPDLAPERLSVL